MSHDINQVCTQKVQDTREHLTNATARDNAPVNVVFL